MRPRWLLNENFPQPSVQRLRADGWNVLAVSESATSAADQTIMRLAREEGR
ncbi:MAG: DUF5615 family PIN-like protein [Gammaproteobacteria bacterium]